MLRLLSRCLCLALLAASTLLAGTAHARRLALVIGNDAYQKVVKLDRAGADAEAVARELGAAGFEVSLHRDLSNTRFAVAVSEFYDKVKKGDEVVVFYAGHGVQTERGAQLLPVDIEGDTEFVVERLSQPVNGLLDSLERLQPRVSVVIIDACRDNPLRAQGRTIGAARGLSGPNVARGQMLMFSAASRERALDSLGKDDRNPNGVFTRELLARMRTPGLSFDQVARQVQAAVEKLAATVNHKQRPLIVDDTSGSFAFYPDAAGRAATQAGDAAADAAQLAIAREDRFWDGVLKADNPEAYRSYLERYPKGEYAAVARAALARAESADGAELAQNSTRSAEGATGPAAGPAAPPAPAAAPPVEPAGPTAAGGPVPVANLPAPTAAGGQEPPPPAPPGLPAPAPVPPPAGAGAPPPAETTSQAAYVLPNGDRYEGEVRGNQRDGRGSYQFANGDRYEGQFVANQFMGQGRMRFANGDRYEGGFQGGLRQGPGVMVFANGDRFEGGFEANLFEGQGSLQLANGERYTGSFHRGRKSGQGEQIFANKDRYVGPFEADKPQGRGTMTHANGDVYEGDFVAGVKQGQGRYRFANGDVYEGAFEAGLFNGKGRLMLKGGDRYEGNFANNVKEGSGVHYFANGDRYEGPFRGGVQQGLGTHYFANGDRFVGPFVAGLRQGKGTYHFANGQSREIEYDKGVEK